MDIRWPVGRLSFLNLVILRVIQNQEKGKKNTLKHTLKLRRELRVRAEYAKTLTRFDCCEAKENTRF